MSRKNFDDLDTRRVEQQICDEVEAYPGDEYWAESLRDYYGSLEESVKAVKDPSFVEIALTSFGLESILADKHVRANLIKALLRRDPRTIELLGGYVTRMNRLKPRNVGGRPRKDHKGMSHEDAVVEYIRQRLPTPQIASKIGITPDNVRAAKSNAVAKGKIPAPPKRVRPAEPLK